MAVRSKRLFGPTSAPVGTTTLYTVPAGETALLKQLYGVNPGVLAANAVFYLNAVAPGNIVYAKGLNGGVASLDTNTFWVLHAGESLLVVITGAPVTWSGYGAELEGVAD